MSKVNVSNRPGYLYMDGNTETAYVDSRELAQGANTNLKICNDGAQPLQFAINRAEDTTKIDGVVPAGKELYLSDIHGGISNVAVKGSSATAYRLWAYQ